MKNLRRGITVGVVLLAICLAFGITSGLGLVAGLYALLAAAFGCTGFILLRLLTRPSYNNHSKNHQEKQISKK